MEVKYSMGSSDVFNIVVFQLLRHVQILVAPWTHQASLSYIISQGLLQLMSFESVMPSNHLTLCCFLLLLPSIFPSIRVFSSELAGHIRWPKYWSFSVNINPSNEYSELISFRIDWFDFLAVQGTLKSLLQHYHSKALILWCLAFFMVQLSHPYMNTGKTLALTIWTFVSKVMSLLLNIRWTNTLRLLEHVLWLWLYLTFLSISNWGTLENSPSWWNFQSLIL